MAVKTPCLASLVGVLALVHALLPVLVMARTLYATDMCETLVRSEKQIVGRNIIRVLPSGSPVDVKSMDETWAAVRLEDGRNGFVQVQQLLEREPYKLIAERLQTETAQQRERLSTLTQQAVTWREEQQRLQELSKKYEQLRQDAGGVVQLQTDHAELQRLHNEVQQRLSMVHEAHVALQKSHDLWWFLGGASVVLAGVFLGILLERGRGRKRGRGGYAYNLPS
jgi:SH3 domain protein